MLVSPDVIAAVEWPTAALGYAERVRIGPGHRAQMSVGDDGAVIVADVHRERRPPQPGVETHLLKVRVADVDAAFAGAHDHGARLVQAPADRPYGERECTVEDLAGHRWQLTQTLRDVAPEAWGGETVSG